MNGPRSGMLEPCAALTASGSMLRVETPLGKAFITVNENGGGQPFEVVKFRSMVPEAEAQSGAVWASERDPRITPAGLHESHPHGVTITKDAPNYRR